MCRFSPLTRLFAILSPNMNLDTLLLYFNILEKFVRIDTWIQLFYQIDHYIRHYIENLLFKTYLPSKFLEKHKHLHTQKTQGLWIM